MKKEIKVSMNLTFEGSQPTRHWSTEHEGARQGGQMNGNQFGWVATGHQKEISEPHGRLIDIDNESKAKFMGLLIESPTIIESEEQEHEQ